MNKLFKIFLLALIINTLLISTVFADPFSEQLQKQKNKLQQDKNSLKALHNKKQDIEINIENLDKQIEDQMSKITENKNLIGQKKLDIKKNEVQIEKIDVEMAKNQALFNNRIRKIYINGGDSYTSILLSSQGFEDFISKIGIIKKLVEFDNKIIKDLNNDKADIKNKKAVLSNENEKLLALNSINEASLAKLQELITSQKMMIMEIKSKEFVIASNLDLSQVAVNSTLKQIDQIRKAAPKISISRGASTISDNNIIAYATNFIGTPYLWGGTSPSPGFDCSGFTQYVYAHFGIRLGRTTYDQINNGVGVSRSELQPGDLVFFGNNGPTHMGMYVGNGTYIHAPHTGDIIKISSVDRSDYITARRVK